MRAARLTVGQRRLVASFAVVGAKELTAAADALLAGDEPEAQARLGDASRALGQIAAIMLEDPDDSIWDA